MILALGAPGIGPLLIVLAVVIIVFGPKRIPALARQLGSGLKEFRKSVGGDDDHEQLDAAESRTQDGPGTTGTTSAEQRQRSHDA